MNHLLTFCQAVARPTDQVARFAHRSFSAAGLVVAVILVGTVLRFVLAATFGFGHAEGYYYSCARHLEWSYFDHPPMHAWLAHAAAFLGGVQPAVLRAPFILFFAGTNWLLFVLGRKLFNSEAGLLSVIIFNLSPVFSLTTAIFLQPDSPLMFFWLLTFYGLTQLLTQNKPSWPTLRWLAVGVSAGLTMLCKYHAAFLLMGAFAYVVTRKDQRHWLRQPGPYLAVLAMSAMSVPVFIWNSQNGWISFLWQGSRGTSFQGFHFEWLVRSIGGQALWLLPWIWVPLIRELYICLRRGPSDSVRWLIACLASPPIFFFTITALYAPYGFHFHWQAPGYLLLFLPLGSTVANLLHSNERDVRRAKLWLGFAAIIFSGAFLLLYSHTVTGWFTELIPAPYDSKFAHDDPTLEALDFKPLEAALAEQGLLDRKDLFIFTYKWYLSGKVDYALRGRATVLCLGDDPRAFAFFDAQADWLGKDGILIADDRFTPGIEDWYNSHFDNKTLLAVVDVWRGQRIGAKFKIFRFENFKKTIVQPYGKSQECTSLRPAGNAQN